MRSGRVFVTSMLTFVLVAPLPSFGQPGRKPISRAPVVSTEPPVRLSIDGGRVTVEVTDPEVSMVVLDAGRRVEITDRQLNTVVVLHPQTFELLFQEGRSRLAINGPEFTLKRDGLVIVRFIRRSAIDRLSSGEPGPRATQRKSGIPRPGAQPPQAAAPSVEIPRQLLGVLNSPIFGTGPSPELVRAMVAVHNSGGRVSIGYIRRDEPRRRYVPLRVMLDSRATAESFEALAALPGLQHVYLQSPRVDDRVAELLAQKSTLEELRLYGGRLTDVGFRHLTSLPNLRILGFQNGSAHVSDAAIEQLRGHKNLEMLSGLQGVTDAGLAIIATIPKLKTLDLSQGVFTAAGLKLLSGAENLVTLNLSNSNVTNDTVEGVRNLHQLAGLNLMSCRKITDDALAHVASLKKLTSLTVSHTKITDAGLEHVSRLTSLKGLQIEGTSVTDAGIAHIKNMTKLETLGLRGVRITDASVKTLSRFRRLRHLNLGPDTITEEGIKRLCKAYPKNAMIYQDDKIVGRGTVETSVDEDGN